MVASDSKRFQITLRAVVLRRLDELRQIAGLTTSAYLTQLINNAYEAERRADSATIDGRVSECVESECKVG